MENGHRKSRTLQHKDWHLASLKPSKCLCHGKWWTAISEIDIHWMGSNEHERRICFSFGIFCCFILSIQSLWAWKQEKLDNGPHIPNLVIYDWLKWNVRFDHPSSKCNRLFHVEFLSAGRKFVKMKMVQLQYKSICLATLVGVSLWCYECIQISENKSKKFKFILK